MPSRLDEKYFINMNGYEFRILFVAYDMCGKTGYVRENRTSYSFSARGFDHGENVCGDYLPVFSLSVERNLECYKEELYLIILHIYVTEIWQFV